MTWMVVRSVYVLCMVCVSGTLVRKDPGRCFLACYNLNKHVCTIIIIVVYLFSVWFTQLSVFPYDIRTSYTNVFLFAFSLYSCYGILANTRYRLRNEN